MTKPKLGVPVFISDFLGRILVTECSGKFETKPNGIALTREDAQKVCDNIAANLKDMPPGFAELINKHFWELLE